MTAAVAPIGKRTIPYFDTWNYHRSLSMLCVSDGELNRRRRHLERIKARIQNFCTAEDSLQSIVCLFDQSSQSDDPLVQLMVSDLSNTWLNIDTFLDCDTLTSFQDLYKRLIDLFEPLQRAEATRKTQASVPHSGANVCYIRLPGEEMLRPRKISHCFSGRIAAQKAYTHCFDELWYHVEIDQRDTHHRCVARTFDCFADMTTIPQHLRIWIYPTIVYWGLQGYWQASRMCLSSAATQHGLCWCKSDPIETVNKKKLRRPQGEPMMHYLYCNGCDIGQMAYPEDMECRHVFGYTIHKRTNVIHRGRHMYVRHPRWGCRSLPSFRALQLKNNEYSIQQYICDWKEAVAWAAVDMIRTRQDRMMESLEREIAQIETTQFYKTKLLAVMISLFVTLIPMLIS